MNGFFVSSDRALFCVAGADRARFLQGLTTNDIPKIADGRWALACFLSPKGKVIADFKIHHVKEQFFVDAPTIVIESVVSTLKKYVLASKVTVSFPPEPYAFISVYGAESIPGMELPNSGDCRAVQHGAAEIIVTRSDEMGSPTYEMWIPQVHVEEFCRDLTANGVPTLTNDEWESLRIEYGVPRFGVDITEENLPLEVPYLEKGISYTKGCYVGQETVARLHSRGMNIARRLMGVAVEGNVSGSLTGAQIFLNEKEVGKITSSCHSSRSKGSLGMGLVHRDAFEAGTEVVVRGLNIDRSGHVVQLPIT